MNAKQFSLKIEQIKRENGDMSYMDAILYYCDKNTIDPAEVGRYISKSLKEKITIEYTHHLFRGIQMSVEERVKGLVAEQLSVDADEIKNESSFIDDLGADSLDTVELVMALEEEFDMEISDEHAENILTVQTAIDYINKNSD